MAGVGRRTVLAGGLAAFATAPVLAQAQSTAAPPTLAPLTGRHRVIIDTDPGNDDALAILLSLDAPNLTVEAITVAPGNIAYDQEVRNALYVVDLAGWSGRVPVHAGMRRPILGKPYPAATFIHGKYGLGRVEVPDVRQKVDPEHAVDAIRRIARAHPGEVVIFAIGGLTNVAMALLREPELAQMLKAVLIVGGRYTTPGLAPGFNMLVDPEAAHVVLTSGVRIQMVGSDPIRNDSVFEDADFDRIAAFGTPRSRFFMESNDLRRTFEKANRGTTGSTNPDPMAVATVIDPAIGLDWKPLFMHVELEGETTRGLLVYGDDIYSGRPTPAPNVLFCAKASSPRFKALVDATLRKAG